MTRLVKQGLLLTFLINLDGLRATCLALLIERTCIHPNVFCSPLRSFKIHLVRTGPTGQASRMRMSGRACMSFKWWRMCGKTPVSNRRADLIPGWSFD